MPRRSAIPKPKFFLKSPKSKEETLIYLIYSYGWTKPLKYSIGEKINPKNWNQDKQKIIGNSDYLTDLEQYMDKVKNSAVEVFRTRGVIPKEDFAGYLDQKLGFAEEIIEEKKMTFFEFIDGYLEELKQELDPDSFKGWKMTFTLLQEFSEKTRFKPDFDDINYQFWKKFRDFLFKRGVSNNYAHKKISQVKTFIRKGVKELDLELRLSQIDFTIKTSEAETFAVNFEELKKLKALTFEEEMDERVRDFFIIGCYVGQRFSDVKKITEKYIDKNLGLINIQQKKGKRIVSIPIFPETERLLKKYNWQTPRSAMGKEMSGPVFNRYIKRIAKKAEIDSIVMKRSLRSGKWVEEEFEKWELISSHSMRRSFATNFYEAGFPINQLMPITGHRTERQFLEYVKHDRKQNAVNVLSKYQELIHQKK